MSPAAGIVDVVAREGERGVDLIALPETWTNQHLNQPETLDGPVIAAMSERASTRPISSAHSTARTASGASSSAVLVDRAGEVAGIYDKVYPYWSEFDLLPAVAIGSEAPVFETDFT